MAWRGTLLGVSILALLVGSPALGQMADDPAAPETTLVVGEPDRYARPLGAPVTVPVSLVTGCHPAETPPTTTTVRFQAETTVTVDRLLVSPANVTRSADLGECPSPDRTMRYNASLVVRAHRDAQAFERFPVHLTAWVVRDTAAGPTWSHGPYHANATLTHGFSPRADVEIDPEVANASAGGTARVEGTIENLSNGPARMTLSVRVDANAAFAATVEPRTLEVPQGEQATVTVDITDQRERPLARRLAAKLLVEVSPLEEASEASIVEQGTIRVHFSGEVPQAEPPLGAPGPGAGVVVLLGAVTAGLARAARSGSKP